MYLSIILIECLKRLWAQHLKQYILSRKLTLASQQLKNTSKSVIHIAYDFGFEYPEVFSRAFKKQFGISPSVFRRTNINIKFVEKAKIVKRDIANYKGKVSLKGTGIYLDDLYLVGRSIEVDINHNEFGSKLKSAGENFLRESNDLNGLDHDQFYTLVNCHGDDNGEYTVFYGKAMKGSQKINLDKRIVPKGYYAKFMYKGDMLDIRETFIDDLYRWIMVHEIMLNPNGVGMLNIYEKDYFNTGNVEILVPIKNTK